MIMNYQGFSLSIETIKQISPITKELSSNEKYVIAKEIVKYSFPEMHIEVR
jgi:hypothetical protein